MATRLTWNGPEIEHRVQEGATEGMQDAVEHLLGASTAVAPIEEGTLIRSASTAVASNIATGSLTGVVYYDTPYAEIQHEAMEFTHDEGRQAKYLEGPALAEADAMLELIAARIRRALT